MTTCVTINDLDRLPHRDGQTVLEAKRPDFEVSIRHNRGTYHIYGIVKQPNGGCWTRLAAERSTVKQARDLAAEAWRDGENFRTRIGSSVRDRGG